MLIGGKDYKIGSKTHIMGILNVASDSFFVGGRFDNIDLVIKRAKEMVDEGADIIDICGESTKHCLKSISIEEELERVIPVIEAVKRRIEVPISINTYKGKVAESAIKAGVSLINDVWGFKKDRYMAEVAAKYQIPCCLMHNRESADYKDLMTDIIEDLMESISIAINAGVGRENIILDPGIGFAKRYHHNLIVMKNLEKLKTTFGYPILLGTSRKSMIGLTLDLPEEKRVEGTIATTVIGIMKGCEFIRVHDIEENRKAAAMADAIVRGVLV
jgi:dihydropteroate synthase